MLLSSDLHHLQQQQQQLLLLLLLLLLQLLFFSVLAVSFLILLQVKLAAQRSQKENLWGLLKHDVLHRECPSCCSAKSVQALTGLNNTAAVI